MSDSETFSSSENDALDTVKITQLVSGYKQKTLLTMRTTIEINIYGYIEGDAVYDTVKERRLRALMQQRVNKIRDGLTKAGVPGDRVWVGGIAFSSNRGGQIDVFIQERKPILLQGYPFFESKKEPTTPETKEQWLDAEGSVGFDPLKKEITTEVSLGFTEGEGIRRVLSPISIKFGIKPDGTLGEASAEIKILEQEILNRRVGPFRDFKLEVTGIGSVEFEKKEAEAVKTALNAKLKGALSADFVIPRTQVRIPVEVSIGVDIKGKVEPGFMITIFKW